MNQETIKPSEQLPQIPVHIEMPSGVLTDDSVGIVMKNRNESLLNLRQYISRKLYYVLEEKLKQETAEFAKLLDHAYGRQKAQAKFTLVLDPNYFEQRFM